MKIKSQNKLQHFHFKSDQISKSFKSAPLLAFFASIIIVTTLCLMLMYYGAVLQKNQTMAKFQQIFFDGAHTKLSIFSNYLSSLGSTPDRLYLDVKFEGIQLLNYARESAMSRGVITEKEQKATVKARLSIGSKQYKVKISPTGLNLDMIGNASKRAYKIKVMDGEKIYGMKEFKLLPPKSRNHIVEWIGHALEDKEGLISLRYFFVELTLNGDDLGVYALEEHFNKELLENRKVREGIIFALRGLNLKIFNRKKIIRTEKGRNKIKLLEMSMHALKTKQIEIERLINIEKFAKYFAIIDLMNGIHAAIEMNSFFYFNPVTNLIEPIAREYNSLRYSDGPGSNNLMINIFANNLNITDYPWISKILFEDKKFLKNYLRILSKISNKKYIDEFFHDINNDLNDQLNIIYKDEPYYAFPKEFLYERQNFIKSKLNAEQPITGNINEDRSNLQEFIFNNNSHLPIEVLSINEKNTTIKKFNHNVIMPGRIKNISLNNINNIDLHNLSFNYSIYGLTNRDKKSIIIPRSFTSKITLSDLWRMSDNHTINKDIFEINYELKELMFKNIQVYFDKNLYIPKGYSVIGKPGLNLILQNGTSIFSESSFKFYGSKLNPIIIESKKTNGGLFINNADDHSYFYHTIFRNLSKPNSFGSGLTGAITIHNNDAFFSNCQFHNNRSEDMLNFIHSRYKITNSDFFSIFSDALDSDYSEGIIKNTSFYNIVNDALDFSNTFTILDNISIIKVGDKALSIGEISNINGNLINISNSEIGIASKDLSNAYLENVNINNTKVAIVAFQKKKEYGPGTIELTNLIMKKIDIDYLIDHTSEVLVEGEAINMKKSNVDDFLYGKTYGRKSN